MSQKGQLADAEVYLRRAMEIYRNGGVRHGEANVLLSMGGLAEQRNLFDEAQEAYTQAAATYEEVGDKVGLATAFNGLGALALDKGDVRRARDHVARSLTAAREVSAREGEAFALGLSGEIAEFDGARSEAIDFYRDAVMIYDQIGMPTLAKPLREKLKRLGAKPHPEAPEN